MRITIPPPSSADLSEAHAREALKLLQRPGTPGMRRLVRTLVMVYLLLIAGVPVAAAAVPVILAPTAALKAALIILSPVAYTITYVLVCGFR